MAHAMRIDSLKFARKLEAAGLDRKAAEAIAEGVTEVDVSDLATKTDIAELRQEIGSLRAATKADIAELRSEMKEETGSLHTEIANLRAELFKQLWIMAAGIVALTLTLSKLFP